jgi:hypothetical protein
MANQKMSIPDPTTRYRAFCYYCRRHGIDRFMFKKHYGSFQAHICGECLIKKDYDLAQYIGTELLKYEDIDRKL